MGTASDAVNRLVVHFDQDRSPSPPPPTDKNTYQGQDAAQTATAQSARPTKPSPHRRKSCMDWRKTR